MTDCLFFNEGNDVTDVFGGTNVFGDNIVEGIEGVEEGVEVVVSVGSKISVQIYSSLLLISSNKISSLSS